ncbi:MAG: hypothetical protein LBO72_08440 [Helicobacteraceae bacterium]|jgi:hypothetical protein|nr:hypothetical protein [Helicobacteraceae bacterium]
MANEPIAPSAEEQKPDLDQVLSEKAARLKVLEGEFGALGQQIDFGGYLEAFEYVCDPMNER